ncbi:MAG: hypothetical protein ABSG95_13780 [Solirubrobacteraceae bacterium]|jgi:hypothetical protein
METTDQRAEATMQVVVDELARTWTTVWIARGRPSHKCVSERLVLGPDVGEVCGVCGARREDRPTP